ncbi:MULTISPECIES: hypothetical protein [unclassified Bacillus (in: firmicutes)]|uniref:hypothetical protein n=1 Tax=unclassified Bacillus (in: firmicutes) TaxID=185979 RepID=UPI000E35F813|nr:MULTISPECIES: hypothetical protein [unclassified Bacillus (in: firmicutes)]AXR16997.1 hypothetical protein DOS87_13120 [Bacillus sp. CR71]AXR22692.1 hypothetical protein DPQ26_12885 [Bacillus sp. E25]
MAEETLVVTDEILERYKTEIILKAKWTHDSIMEAYSTWDAIQKGKYDGKAEEVIRKFVAGITNAMSIVRILNVAGAKNKIYAEKRVEAIKNKWPNLPEAPQGLKQIRNDLEHFEERLDTWAFTSSTHSIVDLNLGLSKEGFWAFGGSLGAGEKEFLRNVDEKNNFLFWNHEVQIDDVLQWVIDINKQIGE